LKTLGKLLLGWSAGAHDAGQGTKKLRNNRKLSRKLDPAGSLQRGDFQAIFCQVRNNKLFCRRPRACLSKTLRGEEIESKGLPFSWEASAIIWFGGKA
jgi:hypothetical protein